jgi:hypothetical protein
MSSGGLTWLHFPPLRLRVFGYQRRPAKLIKEQGG